MKTNWKIGFGVLATFVSLTPMSSVLADELFYKASNGEAAVGVFDRFGNFTQLNSYPAGNFDPGWTKIVEQP
ncbi:hypothetical protein [Nostoc sphaeroides]|uniref:PEP-CTERM sorting domain-containing protein n=1 Tax=Nostoc sphaeroides CCNUC1 TaxID=2653204 RepID=A0A5P8W432_9NOSO|nr:hypothetical protein [Nostoc sphaeroides]QFS47498.1 hypothetical protein GXM_04990 [Nostoc sphaeroides CCNUC1]